MKIYMCEYDKMINVYEQTGSEISKHNKQHNIPQKTDTL